MVGCTTVTVIELEPLIGPAVEMSYSHITDVTWKTNQDEGRNLN